LLARIDREGEWVPDRSDPAVPMLIVTPSSHNWHVRPPHSACGLGLGKAI
jgi:hypothetical protein